MQAKRLKLINIQCGTQWYLIQNNVCFVIICVMIAHDDGNMGKVLYFFFIIIVYLEFIKNKTKAMTRKK